MIQTMRCCGRQESLDGANCSMHLAAQSLLASLKEMFREGVEKRCLDAATLDRASIAIMKAEQGDPDELCACGFDRKEHRYNEDACGLFRGERK